MDYKVVVADGELGAQLSHTWGAVTALDAGLVMDGGCGGTPCHARGTCGNAREKQSLCTGTHSPP